MDSCSQTHVLGAALFVAACLTSAASADNLRRHSATEMVRWSQHETPPVTTAVRVQPGGARIAAAGDTHEIVVWDRHATSKRVRLPGHTDWVRHLDISSDGRRLASGGDDGRVLVWKLTESLSAAAARTEIVSRGPAIRAIQFSQNGQRLAVSAFGEPLRLYSVDDRSLLSEFAPPCPDVSALAFSADGLRLAAGGRDGMVRVWRLDDPQLAQDHRTHQRRVRALAFQSHGSRLYSCGDDGRVVAYDTQHQTAKQLCRLNTKLFCLALLPEDRIAVGASDNKIRVADTSSGQVKAILEGHEGTVASLASDDQLLVSGSFDTTVRLWNLRDSEPRSAIPPIRSAATEPASEGRR